MTLKAPQDSQSTAFKKLKLLGLSKQMLNASAAENWAEFPILNAQFQELFEQLKLEQEFELDDLLQDLIEDNRQYEANIQKSMRTLSKQHAQDVSGVKKLKAYLK